MFFLIIYFWNFLMQVSILISFSNNWTGCVYLLSFCLYSYDEKYVQVGGGELDIAPSTVPLLNHCCIENVCVSRKLERILNKVHHYCRPQPVVLTLDGNSELIVHARSNLCSVFSIWLDRKQSQIGFLFLRIYHCPSWLRNMVLS